jgi:hypothetical protein
MFAKPVFFLAVVISLGLLMAAPQLARSQTKFQVTGDKLTADDGPFKVYGYRDDYASTGVQLAGFDESDLAAAEKRAAEYVKANVDAPGVRAEVVGDNQKKMTISPPKQPKKKGFKDEKKAEPIPSYTPKKFVDVKPYNPPDDTGKSKVKTEGLVNTTWGGVMQWFKINDNAWDSLDGAAFLITFKPDGRCIILTGTSEGTVSRTESRWKAAEGGISVETILGRNNMTFPIKDTSTDVYSNVSKVSDSDFISKLRFRLIKSRGLMRNPPSGANAGWWYSLSGPGDTPDYKTAEP